MPCMQPEPRANTPIQVLTRARSRAASPKRPILGCRSDVCVVTIHAFDVRNERVQRGATRAQCIGRVLSSARHAAFSFTRVESPDALSYTFFAEHVHSCTL